MMHPDTTTVHPYFRMGRRAGAAAAIVTVALTGCSVSFHGG